MAAQEDAIRQRIITHMNNDHQESLVLYLRHLHSVPAPTAAGARLIDINAKQVIVVAAGKSYTIPIDPPMASLAESRERLAAMDVSARKALGMPPDEQALKAANGAVAASAPGGGKEGSGCGGGGAVVRRYVPPSGFHLVVFVACLVTFGVFSRQEHLRPGGIVYERALKHAPAFAEFCQRIQYWLFSLMLGLHAAEASFMGFGTLRKYGVRVGSWLWLQWTGSCFIEGVGSFQRLGALVKEEERGKRNLSK